MNANNIYLKQICNELEEYSAVDKARYSVLYPKDIQDNEDILIEICLDKYIFNDPEPILYADTESLNKELNINLITSLIMDFVAEIAVKSGYCEDYDDFDKKINTNTYHPILGINWSVPPTEDTININNSFIQKDIRYNPMDNTHEIIYYNPYTGEQQITKIDHDTWQYVASSTPTNEYYHILPTRAEYANQITNFPDIDISHIPSVDYNYNFEDYTDNYNKFYFY